jgi:lipopolysaccharide export system protein LptA
VLTHNAESRKLEGKKITDEVKGEVITYLQRTEFFTVVGDPNAQKTGTSGRVKVIIQPKEDKGAK